MTEQTLTLVVLAAGMGSRYGGVKQLEHVGPSGATLMDYSVFDAERAGFRRVVFIVRADIEQEVREMADARFGGAMEIATAVQRLETVPSGITIPAGRTKPWGTAQAVMAAEGFVHEPFAVVNADDFYGRRAYAALAEFLRGVGVAEPTYAIAGYRLSETLSPSGTVNRGVCRVDGEGWLTGMEEVTELRRREDGTIEGRTSTGVQKFDENALVSMNMWGFTPAVFDTLRRGFGRFLATSGSELKSEYLLPGAINDAVRAGVARVRVLDVQSQWFGMTYHEDRPVVEEAIRKLVAAGEYPEKVAD